MVPYVSREFSSGSLAETNELVTDVRTTDETRAMTAVLAISHASAGPHTRINARFSLESKRKKARLRRENVTGKVQ